MRTSGDSMSDTNSTAEKQPPSEIIARGLWHAVNEPRQGYFVLADSLIAALAETGYRIVPREPTAAMLDVGWDELHALEIEWRIDKERYASLNPRTRNIWLAMVEAAGR
jgi:hypothetical protein